LNKLAFYGYKDYPIQTKNEVINQKP